MITSIPSNADRSPSWAGRKGRVFIQAADYLTFNGEYSAGGRQRYIRDLAIIVDRLGREPIVIQKAVRDFELRCPHGIKVIGLKSPLKAWGDPIFGKRASAISTEVDDVIYAGADDSWPYFKPNAKAIQHGIWWDGPHSGPQRIASAVRSKAMVRSVRSVLCVDTNFINWLRALDHEGHRLALKCHYIPNYADLTAIPVRSPVFRPQPRFITARRNEYRRGLDLFCDALRICKNNGLEFSATVCTTSKAPAVVDICNSTGIADRVAVRLENMDSVLLQYQHHDVSVVPTRWSEGTSLSAIEALAAGLPTVSTDVGGLPNIVIPGFNGALTRATPQDIATALYTVTAEATWLKMHAACMSMREAFSKETWDARIAIWLEQ